MHVQVLLKFTATGPEPPARGACTLSLRVLTPRVCGAPREQLQEGEACTPRGSQSHPVTQLSPVLRTRHSLPNRRENSVSEVNSGVRISDDVSVSKCNSYARPAASDLRGARLTPRFGFPNETALQL